MPHLIERGKRSSARRAVALATPLGLAALAASLFVYRPFGWASRYGELAARYGTDAAPEGQLLRWQTVKLGPVRWRRCVAVVGSPAGLWLQPRPVLGRFQPLLIPWSDLRYVGREFLWWQSAYRFEVGQPAITTLTVLPGLYDAALRAYLPVAPATT